MQYIISLASYSQRLAKEAQLTLSSILENSFLPSKICLTIAKEDEKFIPKEFKECPLVKIIVEQDNLKSHLKYYSVMRKYPDDVIITIDDDAQYPKHFIENCIKAYEENPQCINAFRCHRIRHFFGKLMPYRSWEFETKAIGPAHDLFFTGVGGVVYPPGIFKDLINKEDIYKYIRVDDILLNYYAKKQGILVKRIPTDEIYKDINILPFKSRLCTMNVPLYNDKALEEIDFAGVLKNLHVL